MLNLSAGMGATTESEEKYVSHHSRIIMTHFSFFFLPVTMHPLSLYNSFSRSAYDAISNNISNALEGG